MLGRTELLELLRLRARCSAGSAGFSPVDLAKRFKMSVNDTTPVRRPDRWEPGRAAPGTTLKLALGVGDCGVEALVGTSTAGCGVLTEVAGDGETEPSTTHIRCDRVAISFATVCAKDEYWLTWNTGNASRPFSNPRSFKITEIKCMQDDCSKGALAALVRSLTSTVEILPTTLRPLSTTATLVRPSLYIKVKASANSLSQLQSEC